MVRRKHGWQRPLHSLQIVGIVIYSVLVAAFYIFLGLLLGNRIAEITILTLFSFVALSVMFLYIRCTAIDPTDKTSSRRNKKPAKISTSNTIKRRPRKLNYSYILAQIFIRFIKRMERKILRTFIRRQYLDPWDSTHAHMEPLLPFPLVLKDDAAAPVVPPNSNECQDLSYCDLCDLQVNKYSKHCRSCNRCVEGFDHHCRWLNNCIGKRNYTTFFLLMVFVLLMLVIEGGTAVAIFVRCFTDKHGIEQETKKRLFIVIPRGLLATISVFLVLLTAYSSAALGQLFFFHVVLIKKGMRTYDYIHAMREQNQSMQLDPFSDLNYSSDDSSDFDSPEKPSCISRLTCSGHREKEHSTRLSIRVDGGPEPSLVTNKENSHVNIDPWKLMKFSREKAQLAVQMAREKLMQQKPTIKVDPLKPLQLETKCGPLMKSDRSMSNIQLDSRSLFSVGRFQGSPGRFSSPRRRFSGSPKPSNISPSPKQKYRSNFDLRLTEVSQELDTYISRQVLWSNIKKDGSEASPR